MTFTSFIFAHQPKSFDNILLKKKHTLRCGNPQNKLRLSASLIERRGLILVVGFIEHPKQYTPYRMRSLKHV